MSSTDFIPFEDAAMEARLAGRHGRDRGYTMELLAEEGSFDAGEMATLNDAFAEGEEAAKSGYACHCRGCQNLTQAMRDKEDRRISYMLRRRDELEAQGVPREAANAQIEREIAAGAAQQEAAVVVRKSKVQP